MEQSQLLQHLAIRAVSDYIEVKPTTNYIFSFTKVEQWLHILDLYDENKNAISRVQQYIILLHQIMLNM